MASNSKIDIRLETRYLPVMLAAFLSTKRNIKEWEIEYVIHRDYGLILLDGHDFLYVENRKDIENHTKKIESQKIPPMSVEDFVMGWIKQAKPVDFPSEDRTDQQQDGDGSSSIGFRMYNEGHVAGSWRALIAIRPVWMYHAK